MAKTLEQVLNCVMNTVRDICFAEADIADERISAINIGDLHFKQDSFMPGVSPLAGLAAALTQSVEADIPLTEEWLNQHLNLTVRGLALSIYNLILISTE